jgi:hypothetical protein
VSDSYHHQNVDVQPYSKELDYDANGNVIYFGEALGGTPTAGLAWRIRKMTYSVTGNLLSSLWAGGSNTFVNAWDDRAGLSYS